MERPTCPRELMVRLYGYRDLEPYGWHYEGRCGRTMQRTYVRAQRGRHWGFAEVGWLCPRCGYYLPDEPWADEGYREATPEEVVAGREERAADRRIGQRALGH